MALSGAVWFGYVVAHMAGNLKAFGGRTKFNTYAEGLRELGAPFFGHSQVLWILRAVMIVAFAAHVIIAIRLVVLVRRARPVGYHEDVHLELSAVSRSMKWGGIVILVFVIYHLLHLTLGPVHPNFVPGDAYNNLVIGLQSVPVATFYVLAAITVGFHLYHGIWSAFQTLGLNHAKYNHLRRGFAVAFAVAIAAGFSAIPVAVQVGVIALGQ